MEKFIIYFSKNDKELMILSTPVVCRILRDKLAEDFGLDKNEIIVITAKEA